MNATIERAGLDFEIWAFNLIDVQISYSFPVFVFSLCFRIFVVLCLYAESPRVKARPWRERNHILDSKIVSEFCVVKHIIGRINDNRYIC